MVQCCTTARIHPTSEASMSLNETGLKRHPNLVERIFGTGLLDIASFHRLVLTKKKKTLFCCIYCNVTGSDLGSTETEGKLSATTHLL